MPVLLTKRKGMLIMPFIVSTVPEAITLFALLIITVGLLIFTEIMNRPSIVLNLIITGLLFYLFTTCTSTILQVCFIGLAIYSLFRILGRN